MCLLISYRKTSNKHKTSYINQRALLLFQGTYSPVLIQTSSTYGRNFVINRTKWHYVIENDSRALMYVYLLHFPNFLHPQLPYYLTHFLRILVKNWYIFLVIFKSIFKKVTALLSNSKSWKPIRMRLLIPSHLSVAAYWQRRFHMADRFYWVSED